MVRFGSGTDDAPTARGGKVRLWDSCLCVLMAAERLKYILGLSFGRMGSLVCRLANYYFLETNQAVIGNGYNK